MSDTVKVLDSFPTRHIIGSSFASVAGVLARLIQMIPTRTKVIACATVVEEMLPLMPPGMAYQVLDFGLHVNPESLKRALQDAVDGSVPQAETVILGYGLCSQAVIGLQANGCTLVVPRVDDCIAIFLGSGAAYRREHRAEPGTYYLTKGWIEAGDGPFAEHERLVARLGQEKAEWVTHQILKNYTRLALINTGQYELDRYRAYARRTAEQFGLRYEEIKGSTALVRKMVYGPWEDGFVVVPPGGAIGYQDFFPPSTGG